MFGEGWGGGGGNYTPEDDPVKSPMKNIIGLRV